MSSTERGRTAAASTSVRRVARPLLANTFWDMTDLFAVFGVAVVVFASTNVDDILLLAAFFADTRLRTHSVVLGQFLGVGVLVGASAIAAWASLAVTEGYVALLGVVPLAIGLSKLWGLRTGGTGATAGDGDMQATEAGAERRNHSQVLAVAGVTVANGADNLGVYVPLFAREPRLVPLYVAVFAAMTALWCASGYRLVQNRLIGIQIRRYGHIALPLVLLALGLWILSGARVLLG